MKKIIALLTVVLMMFTQIVSASGIENSEAYMEITSLGIIQGDENGDLHLDDPLTRAEFAAVITRLMGYDDSVGMSGYKIFDDVSEEDWFSGYVGLMYGFGIMNGVSETKFSPYTYVTYEQAMKTLVCALGYELAGERAGGYPEGYLNYGTKLRLNKNVETFSDFTRGDIMQMCYNAMDVRPPKINDEEQPTFREIHAGGYSGTYRSTGVVTANFATYLNAPNSSLENDEVEIDDKVYKIGKTDASLYIGQMVEFYAVQDEHGVMDTLVSIRAHKNSSVTELSWNDIVNTSLSEIVYRVDEKKHKANINGAKIIKNGRVINFPTDADVSAERGSVRLVNYSKDNVIDVVFIDDYKNVRVKSVNGYAIEFAEGFTYNGARYLTVNFEDEDVCYTVTDSNGKSVSLSDIEPDSILSISSDSEGEVYSIVVSKESVRGMIKEIGEDMMLIGETECDVYEGDVFDVKAGKNVTAYLDYNGYIADIEEYETENQYAYLVETGYINRNLELKMIVGSPVEFAYEENTENLDSKDLIPVINCQNESVTYFETADNLRVNGVKDVVPEPGLYKYTLNSDGKIKTLESAVSYGGGKGMSYNVYDKVFYYGINEPVSISEKTVVICLPKQDTMNGESDEDYLDRLADTDEEDYMVPLQISNSAAITSFDVFGYDFDTDTKKMNIVVFYETMKADNLVTVNTDTSPIGMVGDVKMALNEEDEYVQKVTIVTKAGKTDYLVADIVPGKNDSLASLKEGDLIYYEIGLSGKLDDAEVIYSFKSSINSFSKNSGTMNYQVCGEVVNLIYDEPDKSSGNLSTIAYVETPRGTVPVTIYQRNIPQMFVYDMDTREVSPATIKDIIPGSDDLVYALIPLGGKASAVVICK